MPNLMRYLVACDAGLGFRERRRDKGGDEWRVRVQEGYPLNSRTADAPVTASEFRLGGKVLNYIVLLQVVQHSFLSLVIALQSGVEFL